MYRYKIKTGLKPQLLVLNITKNKPVISISGQDADNRLNFYFYRTVRNLNGNKIYLPLPVTPKSLIIESDAPVNSVKRQKLERLPVPDGMRSYIYFAKKIAVNLPYLKSGYYADNLKRTEWIIQVADIIRDRDTGTKQHTPARMSLSTGIAEVSKAYMRDDTVPMRMMILMHELMHYYDQTYDEFHCDIRAAEICLRLGFPGTEVVYALSRLFSESRNKEHEERVHALLNFVRNWQTQNPINHDGQF